MKEFIFTSSVILYAIMGQAPEPPGVVAADPAPGKNELASEAESLYLEGKTFSDNYQHDKAIEKFEQALPIEIKLERQAEADRILMSLGVAFKLKAEFDSALFYFDSALAVARRIKDKKNMAFSYNGLGNVYNDLRICDKALCYYDSALILDRNEGYKTGEGAVLNNIASVYFNIGQYHNALAYYDSALSIRKEINDSLGLGTTLDNLGLLYGLLSKYDRALAYNDSALAINRMTGDRNNEARSLNSIGNVYGKLGRYDKALAYLDSALLIVRETNDVFQEGAVLNDIGEKYYILGQFDSALVYYDTALDVAVQIKDEWGESVTLQNIGVIHLHLGEPDKALAVLSKALATARNTSDLLGQSIILGNMARAHFLLERFDTALVLCYSSLALSRSVDEKQTQGIVHTVCGEVYAGLRQYDKAACCYDTAMAIFNEINDRRDKGIVLHDIGKMHEESGALEKAVACYKEAIDVKESIRNDLSKEESITSYNKAETDIYERIFTLLHKLGRYEEAFDYLERSRSDKLRRSFEQSGISAFDPNLRRVLERINFLEVEIDGLNERRRSGQIEEKEYETRSSELEGKLNQRLSDLDHHHPELYNVISPKRKTLKFIQKSIPENAVFLEFMPYQERYIVYIITRNVFLAKPIEEPRARIDNLVSEMLVAMKSLAGVEELDEYGRTLYDFLIKPVEAEIKPYENIVIVPYGILHYLPFHALKRGNERGESEYFIEWKRISCLPSASFLTDLAARKKLAKNFLLAFGNADGSLPGAESEVDSIARLFPRSMVCKAGEASKERFIELSNEYRILHLATHGKLNTDSRFSHIILAPKVTGNLTVYEILGLSNRFSSVSLVTLSACETAVEKMPQKAGMELTTLSNAFKVAGVPSIIASLWEVADRSTAVFMYNFYKNLGNKDTNKSEALRATQIGMMKDPQFSHPYYWAPFILIGDWK